MTNRLPRSGAGQLAAGAMLALLAATTLTACTGEPEETAGQNDAADADEDGSVTPEEVMAYAKSLLDETSGVRISLKTNDEPPEGDYLAAAEGTITTQPAFDGTVSGRVMGFDASDIDVVSVDGELQVNVPVTGWTTFDPSEFCAPDPALLLDPESGVSSVLTAAEGLEEGEAERGGADNEVILTPFDGTVPGEAIQQILPCAEGDEFEATFRVNGDGYLDSADITGEFFPGVEDITYTIQVLEYDVEREITAP
ncbi:lipoprotein LprG [Nocardioides thalensis]|uniref:Lipoprotein LprG n=1 Tax=Nocardioides thalensis TaxID=1914755 RepID=A0A853C3F7_9ACTN|nr:LppX_LprAFG lipoprotein [Nocardioides thalensis]NYJ01829.1 lipoprotein LprG [Nocardioides thalensis]